MQELRLKVFEDKALRREMGTGRPSVWRMQNKE
jgi:hypothetical protein